MNGKHGTLFVLLDLFTHLADIYSERKRQLAKWGEQSWPVVKYEADRKHYASKAKIEQYHNDNTKTPTWDGILLEEVYEALGEKDPVKRRAEFVQVAAVVQAIISDEDRKLAEARAGL